MRNVQKDKRQKKYIIFDYHNVILLIWIVISEYIFD